MSKPSLNQWMLNPSTISHSDPEAMAARRAGFFAASVMTTEDGKTLAVWLRSVPTALPQVDAIVLVDDEGQTPVDRMTAKYKHDPIVVPWSVLAAHLGPRLTQCGTRYYVEPGDFPEEAVRAALGRPICRRIQNSADLQEVLHRVLPRVSEDPALAEKIHDLGEVPIVVMADPSEEFNWQLIEDVPLRVEVHDRVVVVLVGRVGERVAHSVQPWAPLLPMN